MFIRLRRLKMWDAELSLWHKMTNGTFEIKRIWGAKRTDWRWLDESLPDRALAVRLDAVFSGHDFWVQYSADGRQFRPVSYELRRHREELIVLVIRKHRRAVQSDTLFKSSSRKFETGVSVALGDNSEVLT
jgi:hypothetical protein